MSRFKTHRAKTTSTALCGRSRTDSTVLIFAPATQVPSCRTCASSISQKIKEQFSYEERNQRISSLYKNNHAKETELAALFGIKKQRVHQILKRCGIWKPKSKQIYYNLCAVCGKEYIAKTYSQHLLEEKHPKVVRASKTAADQETIRFFAERGFGAPIIAEAFSVALSTVARKMSKMGIKSDNRYNRIPIEKRHDAIRLDFAQAMKEFRDGTNRMR